MQSRKRVFLGLGSNVGDRIGNIVKAIDSLRSLGAIKRVSTLYESKPWGVEDQPAFVNCVVEIETDLKPRDLLKEAKRLEEKLGRVKRFHWGPREIDIDILLYEEDIVDEEDLKIPHPFIKERDFVLVPLLELDRSITDPSTGKPYLTYLDELEVKLKPLCSILEGKAPSVGTLP